MVNSQKLRKRLKAEESGSGGLAIKRRALKLSRLLRISTVGKNEALSRILRHKQVGNGPINLGRIMQLKY